MLHNTAFETPETRFLRFYNDGVEGRMPIGKLSNGDRVAYKLGWKTGVDKMLIISLGTGTCPEANEDLSPGDMNLIYNAKSLPSALMYAALNEQDILCRSFGKCLCGNELDREIGDLKNQNMSFPVQAKLFTTSTNSN